MASSILSLQEVAVLTSLLSDNKALVVLPATSENVGQGTLQLGVVDLSTYSAFITASVSARVTTLETTPSPSVFPAPITLTMSGPVTGSVTFDGSTNASWTSSIANGALSMAMVNGLVTELDGFNTDITNLQTGKQNVLGYTPLNKAGDTATNLLLAADPVTALGAATKQYVDGKSQPTSLYTGNGVLLTFNSLSAAAAAPAVQVIGARSDGNVSQSFSGTILLANNYTAGLAPAGQHLGTLAFAAPTTANDTTTLRTSASISAYADGAWTSTVTPTGVRIYVGNSPVALGTANVTYGQIKAVEINSTGTVSTYTNVTIGGNLTVSGGSALFGTDGTRALTRDGSGNLIHSFPVIYSNSSWSLASNGKYWNFNSDGTWSGGGDLTNAGNISSGGNVSASGAGGFSSTTYAVNARNPIFRFGNADTFGFSYFQGSSGYAGADSIGFHFGTATAAGSSVNINANGIVVNGTLSANNAALSSDAPVGYDVADTTAAHASAVSVVGPGGVGGGGTLLIGPPGQYFAYIKGYYTNGTGNGVGKLVIGTRTTTADTSLTNKVIIHESGDVTISVGSLTVADSFTLNCSTSTDTFTVNNPGSSAAGGSVSITSPGGNPGFTGINAGAYRTDLKFGSGGVFSIAVSANTTGAGDQFTFSSVGNFAASGSVSAASYGGAGVSQAASGSTLVQRTSAGYIFSNYINTTANDVGAAAITSIAVQTGGDGYHRWQTPANFISANNIATKAGNTFTGFQTFSGYMTPAAGGGPGFIGAGNGDGAAFTTANMAIYSWNGIGFGPSITGQPVANGGYSHYFNVRTGDMGARGSIAASGSITAARIYAGYDSGVANSISCNGWFRASGQTGIYCADYGGGIYMTDATYVRTYANKAMAASDFVLTSDAREKVGIRPLEFKGRLKPKSFTMKKDGKKDFGFIAQDVMQDYPEAVGYIEEADLYQLSYGKLTAVLAHQINTVEDEVTTLKAKLATANATLTKLQERPTIVRWFQGILLRIKRPNAS